MNTTVADRIAVDWGTSGLRAWVIGADGAVIADRVSDKSMGVLSLDGFEPALAELIGVFMPDDVRLAVIACGMVGAR